MVWGTPARDLDKFKEQYARLSRLPKLEEKVKNLENRVIHGLITGIDH
jgi:hypothetical protein